MKDNNIFTYYKNLIRSAMEDLKTSGRRHLQIPNLLTVMRLTAPCFIIPAATVGNIPLVLGLTAFFSLTDLADGYIARKWNLSSELGGALDAVTDKVFASTLLLAASFSNPILLSNLALECVIAGINTYKTLNSKSVKSSMVGKLKTWFLFSLIGIGITSSYFNMTNLFDSLLITTTIMQVLTIVSYLPSAYEKRQLKKNHKNKNSILNINTNNIEQDELEKEKKLKHDNLDIKIQTQNNESLEQLKLMRSFLVSEQVNLELDENSDLNLKNSVKIKRK